MAALAIYKHKANIKRLLTGKESRLGSKKAPDSTA
jgi:glycerol-3-phosphate acyltransferase PlsY